MFINKGSNLTICGGWAVNISNFARSDVDKLFAKVGTVQTVAMQARDSGPSQVAPSSLVPDPIYILTWVKWENVDLSFLFKKTMRRQAATRTYTCTDLEKFEMLTAQPPHIVRLLPLFILNRQLSTPVGGDLSVTSDVFFLLENSSVHWWCADNIKWYHLLHSGWTRGTRSASWDSRRYKKHENVHDLSYGYTRYSATILTVDKFAPLELPHPANWEFFSLAQF